MPWRAFGRPEDLDIDFGRADRPQLAIEVLARCCEDPTPGEDVRGELWGLPVSRRVLALLQVLTLTKDGDPAVEVHLRCPGRICDEPFDVPVAYADVLRYAAEQPPGDVLRFADFPSGDVTLRRPTGLDQLRWGARVYASPDEAIGEVVASLIVAGPLPTADAVSDGRDALDAALEAFDPIISFRVETRCPACGAATSAGLDLEAIALDGLARAQRALVQQVHELASAYGWSEHEVLELPASRRNEYLRLARGDNDGFTLAGRQG